MEEIEVKEEYKPTPLQARFIRLYFETNPRRTQEKIAEELGVCRMTIYNWLKKKEFRDWLNSKRLEIINDSLIDIYKTLVHKARQGDFNSMKLCLEMSGNYTQGMKIDTGVQEQIIIEVMQSINQATTQPQDSTTALKQPETAPESIESNDKA